MRTRSGEVEPSLQGARPDDQIASCIDDDLEEKSLAHTGNMTARLQALISDASGFIWDAWLSCQALPSLPLSPAALFVCRLHRTQPKWAVVSRHELTDQ